MNTTGQVLRCLIAACLVAATACTSDSAVEDGAESTLTPPEGDPVLGHRIAEGVVLDGKLWLRGGSGIYPESTGGLVSFALSDWSRHIEFGSGVIDVERSRETLWVLHHSSFNPRAIALTALRSGGSQEIGRFNAPRNDLPIALLINKGNPIVLSQRAVRTWIPEMMTWRVTRLSGPLQSTLGFAVNSSVGMPVSGGAIYVGFDAGEWGGGMQRIDLETGRVRKVEKADNSRRYFYGGPLQGSLDPVTGIIPDRTQTDCVLASIGLVHLGISSGRIVRVCDTEVSVAFENAEEVDFPGGKYLVSEAFFGLAPASEAGYWAVGITGLYQFTDNTSAPVKRDLPRLMPMERIYLSRDFSDAIILRTNINAAVSTSGYTPLVVPLDTE